MKSVCVKTIAGNDSTVMMQCKTVKNSTTILGNGHRHIQCSELQCSVLKYSRGKCRHSAEQCSAVNYNDVQYITVKCSELQGSIVKYG